ncbi:dolichyl-phosphate-mannose--protein mannosyltransferase [Sporichthya polymorpha]|uniref:dolichyl-phosphate-mannose--protein mannosyltransferase n=1 Tax=Sporichthya polymorpha TaxID=35751 RepID=UPI001B7FCB86|nr:phospholipid carrier-dependent glycosyltransferase [Sporichthya polymorpha]
MSTPGGPARVRGSLGPMPTGLWAWLGPLLVTVFGGFLRFWNLGRPNAVVFDETYYVKDSWSILNHGYERAYVRNADAKLVEGSEEILLDRATFIVHPPVGKWVIALGEKVGGLDAVGWRLGVAVIGTASIFLIARVGIRLTRSIVLGCLAGFLLAVDGLAVVMSRTALLDGSLSFFLLAAFACLLVDRDHAFERAQRLVDRGKAGERLRLGVRPWRIAAGLCCGLAVGTKWSALPFLAVFGILAVLWDRSARAVAGEPKPLRSMLRRDAVPAFVSLVGLSAVVYVVSWSGWLATGGGWSRQWASDRDTAFPFIPDAIRSLWHYHDEMKVFHTNLTDDHPYESHPWGWLVLARPVAYWSEDDDLGEHGCEARRCVREVLGIGTPMLWWAATAALVWLIWRWAGARDWRAGAVLGGIAAGWLPWFRYEDRPMFFFYAISFLPYLVLGLTMALGALVGPAPGVGASKRERRRRQLGAWAAGALVLLIVGNFFYLYPLLTGGSLPRGEWLDRMWFKTWI